MSPRPPTTGMPAVGVLLLCGVLAFQGCFDPVYPQLDREARIIEALDIRDGRSLPPSPLTPSQAVVYALANNLDAKVAELDIAYQNESAIAARRRLLPTLNLRYSMDHNNHPSARWSESTRTGSQSLESSFSSDPNSRLGEVGMMWNLIDFGVGYLRTRQQGERIRNSAQQRRRIRQQVVLDVLSNYWRASAAAAIAAEAETLRKELDDQAEAIRDSVEMRILSGAEGARRELAVHGGLAELEQWRRAAAQSKLELGRVMGCGNALEFELEAFPAEPPQLPPLPDNDPSHLQTAALQRRPELFQQDTQERIAVDEARIALLQMAPNANLSLNLYDDPDKFLEWNNWMTVGARVSWNLFNIPARLAERRMALLQGETARQKGLALAAAVMAQVGIAFSEWRLSHDYASTLIARAAARRKLVEALAAGEKDGQTRPGEVLQERVRLLAERAAALRAIAEARVAGARLANAIGLDVDESGRLLWRLGSEEGTDLLASSRPAIRDAAAKAQAMFPDNMSGLQVVKADDFLAPDAGYSAAASGAAGTRTAEPVRREDLDGGAGGETAPAERQSGREDPDPRRRDRARADREEYLESEYPYYAADMAYQTPDYDAHDYLADYSELDPGVMRDLVRTLHNDEPESADFYDDGESPQVLEQGPFRIRIAAAGEHAETPRVVIPEDIQAQVPPASEEYDVRSLPATSFVGLPAPAGGEEPAAWSPDPDVGGGLRPIELPELRKDDATLQPEMETSAPARRESPPPEPPSAVAPPSSLPPSPLQPPSPSAPPESLAPPRREESLRPPPASNDFLKPPIAGPSPELFGNEQPFGFRR